MDRKAWIVLIVCGVLLALNLHYSHRNGVEERLKAAEKQKQEEAAKKAEQAKNKVDGTSDAAEGGSTGGSGEVANEELPENQGQEETVDVSTPVAKFELSTKGGGISSAEILDEKSVYGDGLVNMNGLGGDSVGSLARLSGESLEKGFYAGEQGEGGVVTYTGKTKNNLEVTKTWRKASGGEGQDYRMELSLKLKNGSGGEISTKDMAIFVGSAVPVFDREQERYSNFFWQGGGDFDDHDHGYFNKWFGSDLTEFRERKGDVKFVGLANQFFATIVSPRNSYEGTFLVLPGQVDLPGERAEEEGKKAKRLSGYFSLRDETIPAGGEKEYVFDVFMGPKKNSLIRSLEGDKGGVMRYGWFPWVSRPLNWGLNKLSALFGGANNSWSWGWAIVVLTLIIRILIWPLHAKSTRMMKRMSKLQPKMTALKEKYPDEPQKVQQEMMKLYREYGVNPLGGCLPMLAQIPIFFGFFTMLQYAVELRHEPFLGWVKDLSQPDTVTTIAGFPINVLPILMAVTMFLQMQLTPKTGDKMQQRIFMFMPFIFVIFCYGYASALALYWTTQNIFSIGQTWLMQKMPEPELKTSKKAGKKSFMQKLAEKAEAAQKEQMARKKAGRTGRPGQAQAKPKKPRGPRTGG